MQDYFVNNLRKYRTVQTQEVNFQNRKSFLNQSSIHYTHNVGAA